MPERNAKAFFLFAGFVIILNFFPAPAHGRSFDELFPGLNAERKTAVFSEGGIIRALEKGESLELLPASSSGIGIFSMITEKKYEYLAESLLVVPYKEKTLTILDAYNSLGKIRNLKGRLYRSFSRGAEVALFEDATRVESDKRTNSIPDPPAASSVPSRETIYIRLKDVNFGNTYYRIDISPDSNGLLCNLSNSRSISYIIFPVMKEGKFTALLYLEPLAEGMLVYSIAGTEVSDFVAGKIDIPSAISKRLAVFVDWISDGLSGG